MNTRWHQAHSRFGHLSRLLSRRWHGTPVNAPDWLCPQAVHALRLDETGRHLDVVLHDGVSARVLPSDWRGLPLRAIRAPMLVAQSLPPRMTLTRTREDGTATALVRDRLNSQRCYLLTCGHVVAPDAGSRFDDQVSVTVSAVTDVVGRLREWQPAVGPGNHPSTMDAALVELDEGALAVLTSTSTDWLPRGLDDDITPGRPVALRRAGGSSLAGALAGAWSGAVGGLDADYPTYFLEDAVGYRTDSATVGGDSGAALWSEGDALLGMHIGAINDAMPGANAVMTRVRPALDWFCVKPFTRSDPATLGQDDWPALPARGNASAPSMADSTLSAPLPTSGQARQLTVLAKTLWGEARGEGVKGMEAVAAVVLNRLRTGYRNRHAVDEVCLDPKQFSCWNSDDPNLPQLNRIDQAPDADYRSAMAIATNAMNGLLTDPTFGARHYVATTLPLRLRPRWLLDKTPVVVIGRHEFYNNIQ